TEKMAFRITPSQRRDLFEVARENRTSATDVLRDAANSYVQDYREQRLFRRRRSSCAKTRSRPDRTIIGVLFEIRVVARVATRPIRQRAPRSRTGACVGPAHSARLRDGLAAAAARVRPSVRRRLGQPPATGGH